MRSGGVAPPGEPHVPWDDCLSRSPLRRGKASLGAREPGVEGVHDIHVSQSYDGEAAADVARARADMAGERAAIVDALASARGPVPGARDLPGSAPWIPSCPGPAPAGAGLQQSSIPTRPYTGAWELLRAFAPTNRAKEAMKPSLLALASLSVLIAACIGKADPYGVADFDDSMGDGGTAATDGGGAQAEGTAPVPPGGVAGETNITSRFYTPSSDPSAGLQPVIDAINSAQQTIEMEMFNLTDADVANALATAAQNGIAVQIIIDQGNWQNAPSAVESAIGQFVTPSAGPPSSSNPTQGFRITHEKSFVVDNGTPQATAYIMSLNLTNPFDVTRDYAISTTDPNVIADFETVFQMDLANANANPQTANSPQSFASPYTVLSGTNVASAGNSVAQIHNLIRSATRTIIATTEGLGGPIPSGDANSGVTTVVDDLIAMAGQGVSVQVIAPLCDESANPAYSVPALQALNAGGAQARGMPSNSSQSPSSATLPYMHGKMIVVDGTTAYLGSVNLSEDSELNSREFGIILSDPATIQMLQGLFAGDWANASPETGGTFPSLTCNPI
jgi:phosphatidylserine/phosphatidylglycerophosphate/cardiolipin synthase-like enzyme